MAARPTPQFIPKQVFATGTPHKCESCFSTTYLPTGICAICNDLHTPEQWEERREFVRQTNNSKGLLGNR